MRHQYPFFGGVIQSDSLWGRQIRSDGCSDTDIQRGKIKRERERETDLEVPELLPSSSGAVQPSFGVAQGREEVEPCSRNQMGTFLEHNRQTDRLNRWRFKVKGGYRLCRQLVTQQRQKKWDKQGRNQKAEREKATTANLCLRSCYLSGWGHLTKQIYLHRIHMQGNMTKSLKQLHSCTTYSLHCPSLYYINWLWKWKNDKQKVKAITRRMQVSEPWVEMIFFKIIFTIWPSLKNYTSFVMGTFRKIWKNLK